MDTELHKFHKMKGEGEIFMIIVVFNKVYGIDTASVNYLEPSVFNVFNYNL